jgi:hypothetical protein
MGERVLVNPHGTACINVHLLDVHLILLLMVREEVLN